MSKREPKIEFSAKALQQIEDLENWLGETNTQIVVEAAIASAWQNESQHRQECERMPWIVWPGPHYFSHHDAAQAWLEAQGAEPASPGKWITFDEEGVHQVWEIDPLWFEDQAA